VLQLTVNVVLHQLLPVKLGVHYCTEGGGKRVQIESCILRARLVWTLGLAACTRQGSQPQALHFTA
jgi:hypothetical protein